MVHRSHSYLIDGLLIFVVVLLGVAVFSALVMPTLPWWALYVSLISLAAVAMALAVARWITRPDRLRAQQSHGILAIADESLAHFSSGLNEETAQEVCRIVLQRTDAAAVAITDTDKILGFAGIGEGHHRPGTPFLTDATRQVLATNELRILHTREEIKCSEPSCLLRAGIVVPLRIREQPVGAMKFYYSTGRLLNETQLAMAEGLARLLSTQLELSELDRQTQLACRMELKALQAQINPHFLFNTINTIASLIRTDAPRARELLREFATFYRRTLEMDDDLISLEKELGYVHSYFLFEQARFGERVHLDITVDRSHLDLLVPAFILQPVVENSVQHGMRPDAPLHVTVACRTEGDVVSLIVADDGVGMSDEELKRFLEPGFGTGNGIALKNVHDRLRGHFGPGAGVKADRRPNGGTTITLTVVRPAQARHAPVDTQLAAGTRGQT